MKKPQLDLRNEPVGSLLWKMSLPSITAMLVMAFYNFVDIFWLSRLGPQTIAAVTIAFPIQMLCRRFRGRHRGWRRVLRGAHVRRGRK